MKNVLHFGCVIYLCFSEENGEDYFLTTEGFTKNKGKKRRKNLK
jgi:hypothetical protein